MFWFKGKEQEQYTKEKQIQDLSGAFPSIRRPNQDNNLFEIVFEIDRKYNTLRIYLPSDFPSNKPVLQVLGPVVHPWLDQYKRVSGCEKLTYWTKNTSLTEVVQETLSQLRNGQILSTTQPTPQQQQPQLQIQQNPPPSYLPNSNNPQQTVRNSINTTLSTNELKPNGNIYSNSVPYSQNTPLQPVNHHHSLSPPPTQQNTSNFTNQLQPSFQVQGIQPTLNNHNSYKTDIIRTNQIPHQEFSDYNNHSSTNRRPVSIEKLHIPLPPVPPTFPELADLSSAQLQRLLEDDAATMAHISKLDCVDSLRTMRDQVRQSNTSDANENLSQESEIRQLERGLSTLQSSLRTIVNDYKFKLSQVDSKYTVSIPSLLAKYNDAKDKLDQSNEDLSRDFVDGSIDLQSFLQSYIPARTNYHRMVIQSARSG